MQLITQTMRLWRRMMDLRKSVGRKVQGVYEVMFADDIVICRVELEVPEMKMLRFSLGVTRKGGEDPRERTWRSRR